MTDSPLFDLPDAPPVPETWTERRALDLLSEHFRRAGDSGNGGRIQRGFAVALLRAARRMDT